MRKTTKGAIAVGAGVALLLGGAGTLAYWQVGTAVDSTTGIQSGTLTIAPKTGATTAVWTWGTGSTTFNPATQRIVPGDIVTRTQVFTVTGQGDHLKAEIALNLAPAVANNAAMLTALGTPVTTITGSTVTAPTTLTSAAGPTGTVLTITPNVSGSVSFDVTVKSVVTFPFGTAVDNTTIGQTFDLSGATIVAKQIAFP
ncbi:alternate-type signal peptide domain-containing protein [Cellulomonas sp. P5_C5]